MKRENKWCVSERSFRAFQFQSLLWDNNYKPQSKFKIKLHHFLSSVSGDNSRYILFTNCFRKPYSSNKNI